jgi:pyrimidine-nucleoside phosphorylase
MVYDVRMVDVIHSKRHGNELSAEEIRFCVEKFTAGEIPDYQMSAWLMAVCLQGMTAAETAELTLAMANSGDIVDLRSIRGIKVDKHSTGGVGDKMTLIVAPLAAAAGVPVAKMSGRGLGHTGGTIDKLESIPGFRVDVAREPFIEQVNRCKLAIVGQSGNLAPADKKMYALRDVTATVDSIPLIAGSIMSKKLAAGADAILLDVKAGSGAFMKSLEEARLLAQTMVDIGKQLGKRTVAVLSAMDQPLGREVGNANEVREAIEVLRGGGPADLREIAVELAAHMCVLGGAFSGLDAARAELAAMLAGGQALPVFKRFVAAQGGDTDVIDHPELLAQAKYRTEVWAQADGHLAKMNAEHVGIAAMMLGAGRKTKEDAIDQAAGITLRKKLGDPVRAGEAIFELYSNKADDSEARALLEQCYELTDRPVTPEPLIRGVIE